MLISKEHEQCKYEFYSELDRLTIERGEKDFNYRNYVYFNYLQAPVISGEHLFIEEVYQRVFFGKEELLTSKEEIEPGLSHSLITEGQDLIRIGELLISYGQVGNQKHPSREPNQTASDMDSSVIATALQLMEIQKLKRLKPDRKSLGLEHCAHK